MNQLVAVGQSLRPRQWMKNLLVFTVPLAAGRLLERSILQDAAVAFVVFLFASWFVYLVNDVRDRHEDALHPQKALRPIAAGLVSVGVAISCAALAGVLAVGVAASFGSHELLLTVGAYIVLQLAYQFGLKQVMLIDASIVAAGFILRAVAGGTATGLPISNWFLTAMYSESYLRLLWSASMVSSIIFYSLWAVEIGAISENLYAQFSVIPFSLIVLKYAHHADCCDAESPEHVVLGDRTIQILAIAWLAIFVGQVY